jgi:hypothetical protein
MGTFLCCDLAALGPAAADCLYVSSVLPLKSSNRRRQSETHIETALTTGGSHRADGPRYRVHGLHARGAADPPGGYISGAPACMAGPPQTRGMVQLMVQIKGS